MQDRIEPARDPLAFLGLCSVTLRALPAERVAQCAQEAGLRRIEWGADVHAPASNRARLAEVREFSVEANLVVCSYGSYWRAGCDELEDAREAIRAARSLGTDRVRIWAGDTGSAEANAEDWDRTIRAVRSAADQAEDEGCSLAFEFHRGTLTDLPSSALQLLERVARPNVSMYWQPPDDVPAEPAVEGLRALIDVVTAIHVFSCWPGITRVPLADRSDLWRPALDVVVTRGTEVDLLLEFLPDDEPALLNREAATVRDWVISRGLKG